MRALVVGLGRMGGFHRRALGDLGHDVTTVDPDPRAAADRLAVPAGGRFDVVCVAAPIGHLAERAAAFAGHDGWLMVEKPFAADYRQAAALADRLAGQRVCVGYVERFNPRVLDLREQLHWRPSMTGRFVRWNDRPSPDTALDLQSHDVDLARYLGIPWPTFDTRAGTPIRRREIVAGPHRTNLLSHDTSPLHAMWRAFLNGHEGHATPADAVAVHRVLERDHEAAAA